MAPPAIPPASEPGSAAKRANPRPGTLPEPLWQAILRSYDDKSLSNRNLAWTLGFVGVDNRSTLDAAALLTQMDGNGDMQNLMLVYNRFDNKTGGRAFPDAWDNIAAILNTWDLKAGHGVSTGMKCRLKDRDAVRTMVRSGKYTTWFCEDNPTTAVHGDRDCFREIIKVGRGLHLCVARQNYDPANEDTFDDFHVDEWQVPSTRQADGFCDYHYASEGFVKHIKEAAPWWVSDKKEKAGIWAGKKKDEATDWVRKKTDSWKSSWAEWHPFD